MFGSVVGGEIGRALAEAGLKAVVEAICDLAGQKLVTLVTEPITDKPVAAMDAARDGALKRLRFVGDSEPPPEKGESATEPPDADASER